jgi:hypothetical protein
MGARTAVHLVTLTLLGALGVAACSASNELGTSRVALDCADLDEGDGCSDGNPCSEGDRCKRGRCVGTPVRCGGGDGCRGEVCDAGSGACVAQAMAGPCVPGLQALPLTGCAVSSYTAPVSLGDGQIYQLTLDSGSGTTAVAAAACGNCNDASPRYTPGPGATATGQQTSALYGGGQGWRGPVYTDVVSLGHGVAPVRMNIAAITAQTLQRADAQPFLAPSRCSGAPIANSQQGIFGLGGPNAGAPNTDAYVASMVGATAGVFAVQMCDTDGRAWFGGYDPASLDGAPVYTPLVDARDYYVVEVIDVRLDGVTAALSASDFGLTLVDTGTSITLLPGRAFDALSEIIETDPVFQHTFGQGFFTGGSCLGAPPDMDAAALDAALPRLTVVLPGKGNPEVTLDLPATESYLTPTRAPGGKVVYCPALAPSTAATRGATTILGSSLLHSHVTIFDRPGKQVGFAPQRACAFLGR